MRMYKKKTEEMKFDFVHLRPGDPGFEELAAKVTPLNRIKKSERAYYEFPMPEEIPEHAKRLYQRKESIDKI